ncbi:hypothetical protein FACS189431_2630 [Alphaproteobacteria bacterium]|nr:hypothetical protein FACS189431_2630 [Alphaproteobacteria bacterium]
MKITLRWDDIKPWFAVLATILLVMVTAFGFFNSPIADDFAYYYNLQTNGFWSQMGHYYIEEPGRVGQAGILYLGYKLLGLNADRVLPIISFIGVSLAIAYLLYQLKVLKNRVNYVVAGTLFSGLILFALPSLFDSFLWYTASYHFSIIFLLLDFIMMVEMMKNKRTSLVKKIIFFVIMVVGQTYNELTALVSIALFAAVFVWMLFLKKWSLWKIFVPSILALVIGFAIIYFSPGSIARRTTVPHFDFLSVFVDSLGGFQTIFSGLGLSFILLLLITSIFIGWNLDGKRIKKIVVEHGVQLWQTIVFVVVFLVVTTYFIFCINNYLQPYMPLRVLTMPAFGISTVCLALLSFVVYKLRRQVKHREHAACLTAVAVLILASISVFYESYGIVRNLALRQYAVQQRNIDVQAQIKNESSDMKISSVPINLRSDAFDCFYDPSMGYKSDINWVCVTYLLSRGAEPTNYTDVLITPSIINYKDEL